MTITRHQLHTRVHVQLVSRAWRGSIALLLVIGVLLGVWQPALAQTVILPPVQMHLPLTFGEASDVAGCSSTSTNLYESTPILGTPRNSPNPPLFDPDLNLLVRGYKPTSGELDIIAIHGPTDDDGPQLAHLFNPARVPTFRGLYQVHDWNWDCCPGVNWENLLLNPWSPSSRWQPPWASRSIPQTARQH